jgi:transmembrane sensor
MSEQVTASETLEEVAAGWTARRRSGMMSGAERAELEAWLAADPAHRDALEHVESLWRAAAALRTDPQIMALRDEAARAYPRWRRIWMPGAAAAVLVAVIGGWQAISPATAPAALIGAPQEQIFSTGVGQTATVTLSDGSVVTLDTGTRLRAREVARRRLIWLDRGQAFFKVAHDPSRPFVVTAGRRTITALGTAFNVRLDRGRLEVILTEGRVRVEAARPLIPPVLAPARQSPVAELSPGSALVTEGARDWRIAKVDVDAATSWRKGQLVFVRRPLGDVADELNRYSERKIVVADKGLARVPITGGFAEGDIEAFVRAVEGYGLAIVTSEDEDAVVLEARR